MDCSGLFGSSHIFIEGGGTRNLMRFLVLGGVGRGSWELLLIWVF